LDESALLTEENVKRLYDEAKECRRRGDFRPALEKIGIALSIVLEQNAALRGLTVGDPSSDDAIRLTGFGVHANDFLALQEFLPRVDSHGEKANAPQWKQSRFGHPGNWTETTTDFCLRTFVDVAVKIQDAQWIPGAIDRAVLYDQWIEALTDNVEIWTEVAKEKPRNTLTLGALMGGALAFGETRREVLRTLARGETLKAHVSLATESSGDTAKDAFYGGGVKTGRVLSLMILADDPKGMQFGKVVASEVRVTCKPREADLIKEYFPNLPVIEWEPE